MKRKNILAIALSGCLLIFLSGSRFFEPSDLTKEQKFEIQKRLSTLSKTEIKEVKELFDYFFFFSESAYTLFGTKPMSIERLLPTPKAQSGWEAWQKMQSSFQSKKFILRKYISDGYEFVLVARLEEIEKVYHQNQPLFDRAFQGQMTFDKLVSCLREECPLFQELMHNDRLVGILLGYGAHNADLFAQNNGLEIENKFPLHSFSGKIHPIFYIFSEVRPPSFACDPSTTETKELKKRYQRERKEILQKARKDPLFIQMLAELTK